VAIDTRIPLNINIPKVSDSQFTDALQHIQEAPLRRAQLQAQEALVPVQQQAAMDKASVLGDKAASSKMGRQLATIAKVGMGIAPAIKSGDKQAVMSGLVREKFQLQALGEDTTFIDEAIELASQEGGIAALGQEVGNAIQTAQNFGVLPGVVGKTAGQREFASMLEQAGIEPGSPEAKMAAQMDLGLTAKAGTSTAAERIAGSPDTAKAIGQTQGIIEGGKEAGKLRSKRKYMPEITAAVKLAEKAATERGDVLNDLDRATAAMPSLVSVVGELKELAPIATSTFSGRLFDGAVKELGFGSTKGADARSKFIGIVRNQVLPLLKPTFGAAFTVQEGEKLEAALADPNASPDQKILQLEAFINQKYRNIETAQRQLGVEVGAGQDRGGLTVDPVGQSSSLSDEELLLKYGGQ